MKRLRFIHDRRICGTIRSGAVRDRQPRGWLRRRGCTSRRQEQPEQPSPCGSLCRSWSFTEPGPCERLSTSVCTSARYTARLSPPRAASSRFDEASIVPFTSSEKFVACVLETEAHRLSGVVRAPWSAYLGERDRAAWRARAGGRYCSPACLKEQKTGQFVLFRALIQSVQESAFRFR